MAKISLYLMNNGKADFDIMSNFEVPRIGETISIDEEDHLPHYEIKFIQHVVDNSGYFRYTLVTGIRKL